MFEVTKVAVQERSGMERKVERRRRKTFNRGKWEVEKERHHLNDAAPPDARQDPTNIAGFLAQAMKKLGLEGDHWLDVLQAEWPKIVGEAVAKHTHPGRFEKRRLTVFVDSSTWLNELSRYGQKAMLANIQKRFGKGRIGSVYFQLDPDGGRGGARNVEHGTRRTKGG